MKPQTRFSAATMALVITGIAPAFAEVSTQPATVQTNTITNITTGTASPATFPSPTSTMNKGQIDIATSLAKAQLAQYGITQATPQQLNAALNGGTISVGTGTGTKTVQLQGVLTQRAAGQGWGQIANGMGVKLGPVVSSMKSKQHDAHEVEGREHGKHIITAAGASGGVYSREQGKQHSAAVATAGGKAESGHHEQGKRYGAGIVTASGGSYVATNHSGHQSGHGAGIVTASSAGSSGAGQGHSDEGAKHGKSGK